MRALSLPAASQRLMSWPGGLHFVRRGVEHREAIELAAFDVERADGEQWAGVAAGHEDHSAALREQADRAVEVGFAKRFPPDVDAVRARTP